MLLGTICIFHLISYLLDPYSEYWRGFLHRPLSALLEDMAFSTALCAILCELSLFVDRRLDAYIPWTDKPGKRVVLQAVLQVIGSLLFNLAVFILFYFISNEREVLPDEKETTSILQWLVISTFLSLMISAANTGNYLLKSWKQTALEAAEHKVRAVELQQAAVEAELQALRLQLDPHFVFNNLSVLSELILKDQQLGYEYAESFAKVYRYLLVNSRKDMIPLEEELKFLNAYLFLIKNRIGEGVVFEIDIDKAALHLQLPPMTLQLFIENALKHNQTITASPLHVRIATIPGKELIVVNSMRPLVNKPHSAGIGLSNILSRYALLTDRKPEIEKNEHFFIVKVPLI